MFTGIVQKTGKIKKIEGDTFTITSDLNLENLDIGGSIALNGACLTIISLEKKSFSIQVTPETLKRTNLKYLKSEDIVNLETPLKMNSGLDGHMVQGHVDCIAKILSMEQNDDSWIVTFEKPEKISRYLVEKGFITIDGVSLTIANTDKSSFSIAVIPYTWDNTIISGYKVGYIINLEADMTAKYVENLLKYQPR